MSAKSLFPKDVLRHRYYGFNFTALFIWPYKVDAIEVLLPEVVLTNPKISEPIDALDIFDGIILSK